MFLPHHREEFSEGKMVRISDEPTPFPPSATVLWLASDALICRTFDGIGLIGLRLAACN